MDGNGLAWRPGFYSVNTDTEGGIDWPHDSIVQHEVSHSFSATEGGYWWYEHEDCIMNYYYAYWGTDIWCSSHWSQVDNQMA